MYSVPICLLAFSVLYVSALPAVHLDQEVGPQGGGEYGVEDLEGMLEQGHGLRFRRATCDALSFTSKWLTINHSACAVHCIAKGYKGGNCQKTVCHCRR